MFCSFVQTQLFVLACCSVVLARRVNLGDGVTISAQRPMLQSRPAISKEVVPESTKDVGTLGRDATIKLFPPSPLAMRHSFSFGCKESQVNTITLETDVCLSGDYYLNHNMLISEAPMCPDGSIPMMSYYPTRGCIGEPQFESKKKPIPDYCLWGGIAPKYWSLIFRCGPEASTAQGADKHEVAIPPAAPKPMPYKGEVRPGMVYDGIVALRGECTDQHARLRGAAWQHIVPVDRCIVTGDSIKIKREAICPNGKRAQWARFESSDCNGGKISEKYGLVDIHDKNIDVEQCLTPDTPESEDKIRSVAFWCEGIKAAPLKKVGKSHLTSGTFSEEACAAGRKPSFVPTGIKSLQPDTCVPREPDTDFRSFMISRPAVCANGTRATLALYKDPTCSGQPDQFTGVDFNTMDRCHSYEDIESWAFYCDGVKVTPSNQISVQPVVSEPKQISAQPAVSVPRLGYYNLNACRGDEHSEIHTGYITPTKPDTCNIRFKYPWKLSIAHPAICANGQKASLAVFKDQLCNSQPFIFPVSDDKLNQCLTFDYMGSWAFWCDGEGLGGSTSRLQISKPHSMDVKKVSTGELISIPKVEIHVQVLPQDATIDRPRKADAPDRTRPVLVGVPSFAVAKAAPPNTRLGSNRFGPIHTKSIPFRSLGSYSASACVPDMKPLIISSRPDTCNSISHPFMIHSPARCADGNQAVVALYQHDSCGGQPDQWGAVNMNSTNQCFEFEDMKSWTFWCTGGQLNGPYHKQIHVPEQIPSLHDIGTPRPARDPESSIAMVLGFFVIASLVVMIGIWLWFGDSISHALHVLFPWPFKSLANGEIVLGEDKV